MDAKGYIPISRRIFEHPFWCEDREYSKFEAWLDLLQTAGFENRKQYVGYRVVSLKRGQQAAAVRSLAGRWHWGKHKVELFLKHLRDEGMITQGTDKGTGITIITICKYDTYNPNPSNRGTREGTVGGQQGDTEGTSINKDNNTTLTGSDLCETTKHKRPLKGDCKGEKSESPMRHDPNGNDRRTDWRDDFEVYLSDLRKAFSDLVSDSDWISRQHELNPGIDVRKSLEKACLNFWATREGWERKKAGKKTETINWRLTLANAVSQPFNRVYYDRKNDSDNGYRAAREAEKRAGREELGKFAAAVLSGFAGKADQ